MKKYVALEDSYGFQKRYWNKGDILELPDDHKCPEYFKLAPDEPKPVEENLVPEPTTFSAINEARKKVAPKTGMGYSAEEQPTKPSKPSKKKH